MTGDVVLTAALRNNLLSLQGTQSLIDVTQFRLSTGKKVNSALDNPQSFFASQALTNRAKDLGRLLDGLGQSIQTIKAADNGITSLTKLVEQADSVATNARDAIAQGQAEAKVTGTVDLRGINDLDTGLSGVANGDTIVLSLTDSEGTALSIGAFGGASGTTATITINTNDSTEELIAEINNIVLEGVSGSGTADGVQAFEASLDDAGQLQIKAREGNNFRANFVTALASDSANLGLAQALGFGNVARLVADDTGAANNNVEFTAIAATELRSIELYDSTTSPDSVAQRGDRLTDLVDSAGGTQFANIDVGDSYLIGINGGTTQSISLFQNGGVVTVQEFIDQINNNTNLNSKIEASFDDATGQVVIRAIDPTVQSIETGVGATVQTVNFGFGVNADLTGAAGVDEIESIRLASAAGVLAGFEDDFNNLREQIDALVKDTGYRGTNLLNGDDLLSVFNEDRTSTLTTQGVTFTSDGLDISEANFSRLETIETSLAQVREALSTVRTFGSSLANDLSIIQTREDFTKKTVNTLTEGSDKLTLADQNEEGAKLLALQTRQQLGVTSLALASQSAQSVLRLF